MNADHDADDRIEELGALPREVAPPADMEARVIDALRAEGLIGARSTRIAAWGAVAAGLALFVAGFAAGAWQTHPIEVAGPATDRYLLLLYGEASVADGATEHDLVVEYGAWARTLREQGVTITGERLDDRLALVSLASSTALADSPSGFFIVAAGSLDEARAVARSCPHVQRGGSIVVRPIAPT